MIPIHHSLKGIARSLLATVLAIVFGCGLMACSRSSTDVWVDLVGLAQQTRPKTLVTLQEVAPPALIQQLRPQIDRYEPQVKILSPAPGEVLERTTAEVRFAVEDYPLFKNAEFSMGPHLHVFLDDQSYTAVYSTESPLVLTDLAPGTHTLRVFASRPWHESFKNEGAYAQVTFHVFTETGNNAPNPDQPLLTYSRPQSSYGAEPILLDFYLTNAPLHFLASEDAEDEIPDWRVRATINGESFLIDRWEPIYLQGFKEGENWVKLEFLGENGEPLANAFNTTARLVTYVPNGTDGLSRIVRGGVSLEEALAIVVPPGEEPIVPSTPEPQAPSAPEEPSSTESIQEEPLQQESIQEEAEEVAPPAEPVTEEPITQETIAPSEPAPEAPAPESPEPAEVAQSEVETAPAAEPSPAETPEHPAYSEAE